MCIFVCFVTISSMRFATAHAGFNDMLGWLYTGSFRMLGYEPRALQLQSLRFQVAQLAGRQPFFAIVGDSNTVRAPRLLEAVCGRQVLFLGLSGATVATVNKDVLPILDMASADGIILAIGTNNAYRTMPGQRSNLLAAFENHYRQTIDTALQIGGRVAILAIPPIEKNKLADELVYDLVLIDDYNATLSRLALENPAVTFLPNLARHNDEAVTGSTIDGEHLSTKGYGFWREAIDHSWRHLDPACRLPPSRIAETGTKP